MDKRTQRTETKRESIKKTALKLFASHGVDKVSMDEIADKARVSKVTIYKYFGSKEELYSEVIDLFINQTLMAAEEVLNSDVDFLDKLKFLFQTQTDSSQLVTYTYLFQLWENSNHHLLENLQSRLKTLMYQFFEEGKRKGYINSDISFDILYLYTEIFRAGFHTRMMEIEAVRGDKQALEALYNLYFFGFINRR